LLTEGEVFKDEILAGTERTDHPAKEVPEPHDHGKNLNETSPTELIPKSDIADVRCFDDPQGATRSRRMQQNKDTDDS
jgi:hypothetical protein